MAQAQTPQKDITETVLLRKPLPKYSFQARKLPKESPANQPTNRATNVSACPSANQPTNQATNVSARLSQSQSASAAISTVGPTGVVNLSSSGPAPIGLDRKSAAVRPFSTSSKPEPALGLSSKPIAAVVAPNVRSRVAAKGEKTEAGKLSKAAGGVSVNVVPPGGERNKGGAHPELKLTFLPSLPRAGHETSDIPIPDAALLAHTVEGPSVAEKLEKAEKEIAMLRSQLDVQLQVNAEIKRLLVASVGEDFERKVENLARDRAQLAMELGDFTKKMTEDYEHLDQISIQADMWRSKYLASRVMVEELASARAFYSSQFQDSQQALQELLNERYELRTGLLHSYKILQQVKEAFDPFNTQKSHSLDSTNVLDLTKHIKQLSEAVRFRLLPAHAGSHIMMPLEESWESTMTKAELLAYDQLSNESAPPSFKHSMPSCPPSTTPKSFERFHPLVRNDNLTVNCCSKCKGEIKVA